ncbi:MULTISPECIES: glycoside hydrolase family 75 protein [unclassified Streptomyces]|uniref:glycoside hydrolase family 75 protein n=1 Tax=unclassified Streptomyces TaxID=2593676 RepID=UPI00343746D7
MPRRPHAFVAASTALLAAAVIPATVLPALAVPAEAPHTPASPARASPDPAYLALAAQRSVPSSSLPSEPLSAPPHSSPPHSSAPHRSTPHTSTPRSAAPHPSAPPSSPSPERHGAPPPAAGPPAGRESFRHDGFPEDGPVTAAALLSRAGGCDQISNGLYRAGEGSAATIPVCDAKGAVFWNADMDIDCDGQTTTHCNSAADPYYQPTTAYTQADGRALNPEELPYVVVPLSSSIWNYRSSGIRGGSVAAVIHRDKVEYAVVGDTGPPGIIGEASYATARALGIVADPAGGGVASGVTYIVFKDSEIARLDDQEAIARRGDELAKQFIVDN